VGSLHIPGRTFHVEQFYLEDLIEARLRTALAAEAAGKAAAAATGQPDPSSYGDDRYSYGYEPASFAAYLASSEGGALGASAAAARAAARCGADMPFAARLAGGSGNPKFAPTLRDFDRELKGYVVRVRGCLLRMLG
jgi:hypothetical protein